ncbi:allophanate hydrolase [Aureimonas sp. SA4125]|uniref:cupin domain-containing protein n=1 Tax=Aureimonas sp. SA4125 TaxID=2826993 RepID=UPI001CC5BB86|nr:cupin domain-containing protein [Aureimonas sp. SA4125]BDA84188.1 allophanate hydrolase [Aureimonas sp. SA4125]
MTPLVLPGLALGNLDGLVFEAFRDGVTICHLQRSVDGGPGLALLRYAPGASVPRHEHVGLESIVVIDGSQSDEHGTYEAGTVVVNPVGSVHSVWSEQGCLVLISWAKPVRILGE